MTTFDHFALRAALAHNAEAISANDYPNALVTKAVCAGEAMLSADGALTATTGAFTGRSPKDKFIVCDELTRNSVWWENAGAISPVQFDALLADYQTHIKARTLYRQDLVAGADPAHNFGVTVFTEAAWHALFIRNLLIENADTPPGAGKVTILHAPSMRADPGRHGARGGTMIALDMTRNLVIIAGTAYAGEIKKSVFSLFNFHGPARDILPMHCSANVGPTDDVALFFGLSGTGKTTLSNTPGRRLIGDDEHGWTPTGVFNLEGGCYAKTINLSADAEPEIFAAASRFATVLENVALDTVTGVPDFNNGVLTENTRAAYPLAALPAIARNGQGSIPKTVILLTADAFGVLPPIARLTPAEARYHFLSGYTAKIAGTERGVIEPQATFSACFGAPFMPLHPGVYGNLLAERLRASGAATWLINTGWTGGGYGVGKRIDIASTRRLVEAALSGELKDIPRRRDPVFGLAVPHFVAGIDPQLLDPRQNWADPLAYDRAANQLLAMFAVNFEKFGGDTQTSRLTASVLAAE